MFKGELSEKWILVKIGNQKYFDLIMGQSPPSESYNRVGIGLPFFQGKAEFGELYPTPQKYCSKPLRIAEKDDVLISVRAPVGPTNLANCKCSIGRGLAAIKCKEKVLPKFLLFALRSIENDIADSVQDQGGGFTAIKREQLEAIEIPIPPLEEQQRIVSRIEALTKRVEEARKLRQQTVLNVIELWNSILANIFRNQKADCKRYKLGEVLTFVQYGTSTKLNSSGNGVPVIRMGNIINGIINFNDIKYLDAPYNEYKKYLLEPGDILINRTNSSELVGKAGLFESQDKFIFASYLIRLRSNYKLADPYYLNYLINSETGQAYLKGQGKDAIGQTNINTQQIKNMPICLPSLKKQKRTANYLKLLQCKIEELKNLQMEAESEINNLSPALLAKAFRGEL